MSSSTRDELYSRHGFIIELVERRKTFHSLRRLLTLLADAIDRYTAVPTRGNARLLRAADSELADAFFLLWDRDFHCPCTWDRDFPCACGE